MKMRGMLLGGLGGLVLMTSGCASFSPDGSQSAGGPGQATYHYKRTPEGGCEVIITSAREVPGLEASVDENCAVTVKAEALTGLEAQTQMMQLWMEALKFGQGLGVGK